MGKPTELKELSVEEVSLVPKGANQKDFLIVKSGEHTPEISKEFIKTLSNSIGKAEEEINDILKGMDAEVISKIKNSIRLLDSAKSGMPEDSREILGKIFSLTGLRETNMAKKEEKVIDKTEVTPAPAADIEVAKEAAEVEKEFNGRIEKLEKDLESSDARFKEVMETLAKERDEASDKEFAAKAAKYENLGADKDKLGKALKAVSKNCEKEVFEVLEKALDAANTAVEKGDLFTEIGSGAEANSSDASEKLAKIAAEIVSKEDVTVQRAEMLAMERNEDLYAEIVNGGNK